MSKARNNNHKFILNAGPYLLAFFLPVFIMCIVFLERGFYPFGDRCFLRTDLYHQYAPFTQELKKIFSQGGSLFYNWNIGAGTNFWALSAYYLASPTNLLLVFCPQKYIIEFITFMIVNKEGLCSLTLAYYLNKRHKKTGLSACPAAFFGTFYALSGYMCAYQWNIMWLDCLWLFPLVIMGLERLWKENKGLLYCAALGLTIFSNYYIAIMVCMGVAVYCFFLLGTEPKMRKSMDPKLLKFIGYTIIAIGFSAVFLFPYIRYFNMTASADSNFNWEWYSYFSVFDMASRHLFAVDVHTGLDHWPNIYCGVMVYLGLPLYYLNNKIPVREKIGYTVLLIFFYFSFSTRAMDYIWHVLHIPNSLPCRQAFIYIFIMLVMCYRGFIGIKDRSYRELTFTFIAALVFVFMAEHFQTNDTYYHNYVFYGSAIFLTIYTVLMVKFRNGRSYTDVLLIVLLAVCCIENTINTTVTSIPTVGRSDYTSFDRGVRNIMNEIKIEERGKFYRVEKMTLRTKNDGAWLDYPSLSTFSSVANKNLTAFYKTLGMESSTNAYGSNGQTPFTDMLLDVKYLISTKELKQLDNLYRPYDNNNANVWFYKNNYVLPLGYMLDTTALEEWNTTLSTPLRIQNDLAYLISGKDNLFLDVTPLQDMEKTITMVVPEDGFYYAYSTKSGPKSIQVNHGEFSKKYSDLNRSYIMDLGWCTKGEEITMSNTEENDKKIDVRLYRLQTDLMDDVYEAFSANGLMEIDSYKDTEIKAHVDVKEAGTLFTSIAAEEGWDVYVDGEKVEYEIFHDAYITLKLPEGHHDITFRFHVPLFFISLFITLGSLCVMILCGILGIKLRKELPGSQDPIQVSGRTKIRYINAEESDDEDIAEPIYKETDNITGTDPFDDPEFMHTSVDEILNRLLPDEDEDSGMEESYDYEPQVEYSKEDNDEHEL